MSPSKTLFHFCLFFIIGIFLNSVISFSLFFSRIILVFGIFLIFLSLFLNLKLRNGIRIFGSRLLINGFFVLFLVLGILRHQIAEFKFESSQLRKFNDSGQEIILKGIVFKEPDVREKSTRLIIRAENGERVLVVVGRYPEYHYGDILRVIGKLQSPRENLEGFNYQDYLKKDLIYSVIYRPKIELLEKNQGNWFYAQIIFFKNKLKESIESSLSPSQSSILGAIILGDKKGISLDLKEKLNIVGLRHITAVSGMHVVILTGILMNFLIVLGFWRGQAFYLALVFIFIFIVMTGFQSSAIRAGIMGGLFLLGQKLGRFSLSSRAIVMAAALMLMINPWLLMLDVGFQLSFLATLGIIYFTPIFQYWLTPESSFKVKFLTGFDKIINSLKQLISPFIGLLAMTLSAQIFTFPVSIYNFGSLSLIAPLTNILVVPLLPFIMAFGFLAGLVGIFWQSLSEILFWPVWILLSYLLIIVEWFSFFPGASLFIGDINWVWLFFYYFILGFLVWRLSKKNFVI